MDAKANDKLIEVGTRLRSEREENLRTIADLKNANAEQREALEAISSGWMRWKHPSELATQVRLRLTTQDDQTQILMKIFRMVSNGSWNHPDEVLAAVARFVDSKSKSVAADVSQQLEREVQANIELRKELSRHTELTKQAQQSLKNMREQASIADQSSTHWKTQTTTTEAALRKSETSGTKYKALRSGVLKALRNALEQVKNGGVSEENSARYNSAFNKGMKAGASIVEVEIYDALSVED